MIFIVFFICLGVLKFSAPSVKTFFTFGIGLSYLQLLAILVKFPVDWPTAVMFCVVFSRALWFVSSRNALCVSRRRWVYSMCSPSPTSTLTSSRPSAVCRCPTGTSGSSSSASRSSCLRFSACILCWWCSLRTSAASSSRWVFISHRRKLSFPALTGCTRTRVQFVVGDSSQSMPASPPRSSSSKGVEVELTDIHSDTGKQTEANE